MRVRRTKGIALAAALLAATGCAGMRASSARRAYEQQQLADYVFPRPCPELWVDALKILVGHEFMLVGSDRQLVGQPQQGAVAQFMSRGHATTMDDKGVMEAQSDANDQQLRYQVRATPAGPNGCKVNYTAIQFDRVNETESTYRDYDYELELVSRISPADGARISLGADEAAARASK